MPGLVKQPVHIPLARGVNTKAHELALEIPLLAIAHNVYYPRPGSISKRLGTASISIGVDGGGTLSNIRGLATRDEELIAFATNSDTTITKGGRVFSWSPAIGKWRDQGPFEAAAVRSRAAMERIGNQVEGDRASILTNGNEVVVYAFLESGIVVIQVIDGATGTPLTERKSMGANTSQPRCVAVNGKLCVIYWDTAAALLKARVIDPANPRTTLDNASVTVSNTLNAGASYDIAPTTNNAKVWIAYRNAAGQYDVNLWDTVANSITSKARTTGANQIALAYEPNIDRLAVFRTNATDLVADLLNGTTAADVFTSTVIEAGVGTIYTATAVYRKIALSGGAYQAVLAYGKAMTVGLTFDAIKVFGYATDNAVAEVAGPKGVGNPWAVHVGITHRAFARGFHVYFGANYLPRLVGSYTQPVVHVLVRDDGMPLARLLPYQGSNAPLQVLPSCWETPTTDVFATVLLYRARIVDLSLGDSQSDFGFREFRFDFASNSPYRGTELGAATYMPGGLVTLYDGIGAVEAGFLVEPYVPTTNTNGSTGGAAGTGLDDNGNYFWRLYFDWYTAQKERMRGTFVHVYNVASVGAGGGNADDVKETLNDIPTLPFSWKRYVSKHDDVTGLLITRTEAGGGLTFYRITSADPASTGDNKYLGTSQAAANFVSLDDSMEDPLLVKQEPDYQNSGELDNVPNEFCDVLAAGQSRLFSAGHENPHLVRFSKLWQEGETVNFNDALTILVPQDGGRVTAVSPGDSQVIVWKERRIYTVQGLGPSNLGIGEYADPQLASTDVGCIDARSIVLTPRGYLFQSEKGIYLFNGQVEYVGAPVEDYATNEISAALLLEDQHLVVFFLASAATALNGEVSSVAALVYDYMLDQWATWSSPANVVAAVMWQGKFLAASSSTIVTQTGAKTDLGVAYTRQVRTPWIKTAGFQGFGRVYELALLGDHVAAHKAKIQLGYNYEDSFTDVKTWTPTVTPYQVRVFPSRQKVTSLRVDIQDVGDGLVTLADSADLVALSMTIGVKSGLTRVPTTRSI